MGRKWNFNVCSVLYSVPLLCPVVFCYQTESEAVIIIYIVVLMHTRTCVTCEKSPVKEELPINIKHSIICSKCNLGSINKNHFLFLISFSDHLVRLGWIFSVLLCIINTG